MSLIRLPKDYLFGTLSNPAAESDTSLSSADFTSLDINYTTQVVLPLVLHNPATHEHEVVWVTNHSAGSQTVTVVRGKEGTDAQPWPGGTQWICAPTVTRDGLLAASAATVAAITDAHLGMRAVETDTGLVKVMTSSGLHSGLYADPAGLTPGHGSATPASAVPIIKAFTTSYSPNASGVGTVNFPGPPFPNGVIAIVAMVNSDLATAQTLKLMHGVTNTSSTQILARTPTGAVPTDTVTLDVIAIGY